MACLAACLAEAADCGLADGSSSQGGVLLACHRLYQGYWSGGRGYIIDHECDVPFDRDHAMVSRALVDGFGVEVRYRLE